MVLRGQSRGSADIRIVKVRTLQLQHRDWSTTPIINSEMCKYTVTLYAGCHNDGSYCVEFHLVPCEYAPPSQPRHFPPGLVRVRTDLFNSLGATTGQYLMRQMQRFWDPYRVRICPYINVSVAGMRVSGSACVAHQNCYGHQRLLETVYQGMGFGMLASSD